MESDLEKTLDNKLKMSSIGLPMIPTILAGSAAMAFGQEYASDQTMNNHVIVAAGMSANIIARNPIYLVSHLIFNRERLIQEKKLNWKRTMQDAASFFASSKIGYFAWAASCFASSEYLLHQGYSPIEAGLGAGLLTGSAYTLFLSAVTPKIDSVFKSGVELGRSLKKRIVKHYSG
ncbi:MAG: hypothetical protein Q7S27_06505 [Nanoarchaeota archaeon]|nr:hypothetical protein [Nanoarchaeota archaeon]